MRGLIIKGIGGFYYVKTENGVIEAKGRGIFKKQGITLCVGDEVEIELLEDGSGKGVIEKIYPRENCFIRPPIANVDLFAVVFAAKAPSPNYPIIDKFLINAQMNNIDVILCINKKDLATEEELEAIRHHYDHSYKVVAVSAKTEHGMDELLEAIKGKKTALAGPSGVGKSSIINKLHPPAEMETGEVSKKTLRGKHTTRHVEIFETQYGGMLFDTPGFTSFDISNVDMQELKTYYPEFEDISHLCKYDNCNHVKEPGCSVREALENGEISQLRYSSYISNLEDIKKKNKY